MGASGSGRIPALDGLRGLAALLVLLGHLSQAGWHLIPGLDLQGTGKPAVYLFFVLSAFLLTRQLCGHTPRELSQWLTWRDYSLGRGLRIIPLYLVVVVTAWATTQLWGLGLPVTMGGRELLETALLLRGDGLLWTIPTEFKFYLVLPLLAVPLARLRATPPRVVAVLGVTLVAALFLPTASRGITPWPFLGLFLSGGVLGWADAGGMFEDLPARTARWLDRVGVAGLGVAVMLTPAIFSAVVAPVPSHRFHMAHALWAALWGVVLVAAIHGSGRVHDCFEARAPVWLGSRSFSLYLWHLAALRLVGESGVQGWLAGLLAFGGSMLLAEGSYRTIERPVLRLSRRLRARATPGTGAPAPLPVAPGTTG